ncbi:MAG: hypothetical protein ACPGYL_05960, partial [Rhodospirillaceae bacterium]
MAKAVTFKQFAKFAKQLPREVEKAAAIALTRTARHAAVDVAGGLDRETPRFPLNRGLVKGLLGGPGRADRTGPGIPYPRRMVEGAQASDGLDKMAAVVGIPGQMPGGKKAPNVAAHFTGGTDKAREARRISVPSSKVKRTKRGGISKSNRLTALFQKKRVFAKPGRGGNTLIYTRPKRRGGKPVLLYTQTEVIRMTKKLSMDRIVRNAATRHLQREFEKQSNRRIDQL